MWKTDGTTVGTVNVASSGFNSDVQIFKNEMFYSVGHTMYKSNGTTAGTVVFKDSVGEITGMNNDYFLARYMKTFPTPPYFENYYWRSDGTAAGTVRVADSLIAASSFAVLNNKMYSAGSNTLWESDGTNAGTSKRFKGIVNYPTVFNNQVFFSGWPSGDTLGYELYSFTPGSSVGINETVNLNEVLNIYPNPSSGIFKIDWKGNENISVQVFNIFGEQVLQQSNAREIDLSTNARGIYFVKIKDGQKSYSRKVVLQ